MFSKGTKSTTKYLNENEYAIYEEQICTYVASGKINDNINKFMLIDNFKNLSPTQKDRLKQAIRFELPMDDFAYIAPVLNHITTALKWSAGAAFVIAVADYQRTESYYHAATSGFIGGALTFMGSSYFKRQQNHNIIHSREMRAKEFLSNLSLSELKVSDFQHPCLQA